MVSWVECENKYGSNASLQRWLARILITISLLLADKSYLHIGVKTEFSQTSKLTCNTYCVRNFVFKLLIAVIFQRIIIKLYGFETSIIDGFKPVRSTQFIFRHYCYSAIVFYPRFLHNGMLYSIALSWSIVVLCPLLIIKLCDTLKTV